MWCWLSDPKVRHSAKILNKSNVSWCTYYWLEPKAADSFKDLCRHKLCGMSTGTCHVSRLWQVNPHPIHIQKCWKSLTLRISMSSSLANLTFSLSVNTHCTFHQQPGRYNRIHPCIMTSGTVNVCSSLCKHVLPDVYMHSLTVTVFSVLSIAMG